MKYKDAGVDKEEGYRAVERMKSSVKETHTSSVLQGLGSFASLYALGVYKDPILVSGTDGVGTKLEVAIATEEFSTVGIDCFAMCANDVLCHGAKPLFFLDYLACGVLESEVAATLVEGIATACKETGTALVGGETAEMPGFYKPGDYDMAGFCVGVVERENLITGEEISEGDLCIGLTSSGLHSNGYSLVRTLIPNYIEPFLGEPIYRELLKPTRLYGNAVLTLIEKVQPKGLAHITGGGIIENLPRVIPKGLGAKIRKESYPEMAIFKELARRGADPEDMWGTFNMGIGFVIILSKEDAPEGIELLERLGESPRIIGEILPGEGVWFA